MYYIIGTENQYTTSYATLKGILEDKVLDVVYERVKTLDEFYGGERDLKKDLGGYCVVFPTVKEWEEERQKVLDNYSIQNELYEYREEITGKENCWIEEFYVTSSDYGIVVFYPEKQKGVEKCC